ncbi:hypothetical protein HDK77DRAFT_76445 [Phyllosticta capitalensis]
MSQQQQPPTSAAYAQPSNPVSRNPAESASSTSSTTASANAPTTAHRTAPSASSGGDDGVPSALGRGVHGTSADADAEARVPAGQQKQRDDVDADEQMAPPGEGAVADAVAGGRGGKTGAQGAGGGLSMESDLERKKAEQAPLREAVKEERARGVDVGGALGQTGGHAT